MTPIDLDLGSRGRHAIEPPGPGISNPALGDARRQMTQASITVVIPTYRREAELVNTLVSLEKQIKAGDEILVIDQTPRHVPETELALRALASRNAIRWFRKKKPSQCEAVNAAARLARGRYLVVLDDDIIPSLTLLEGHRHALAADPTRPATAGQVLQPWHPAPVAVARHCDVRFDLAYDKPCEILSLMAANFAMPKEVFISVGGMDENFAGQNYRNDAELAYRIFRKTSRRVSFVPEASLRHLLAGGGNRAFGAKDTWPAIGGSIGDYYFAFRSLPAHRAFGHALRRLLKEPLNRYTARHPWRIPWLQLREVVAVVVALHRAICRRNNYIKALAHYTDIEEVSTSDVPAVLARRGASLGV
jgi:GT2 family glycosyltransferase